MRKNFLLVFLLALLPLVGWAEGTITLSNEAKVTYNGTATPTPTIKSVEGFVAAGAQQNEINVASNWKLIAVVDDPDDIPTAPAGPAHGGPGANNTVAGPTHVGTWYAVFQFKEGPEAQIASAAFTVEKRSLRIELDELHKTYGDPDPDLATIPMDEWAFIEGWGEGDDLLNTTIEGIAINRTQLGEDAYDDLGNQIMYSYTLVKETLKAKAKEGGYENYKIVVGQASQLLIDKAPLTINVKPVEKVYKTDDPTFTWEWPETMPAKNQLKARDLNGDEPVATFSIDITRKLGEAVGTYDFIGVNPNYAITTIPAVFTIKPTSVTEDGLTITSPVDYAGKALEPAHSVVDKNGNELKEGTQEQVAAGTADYWSTWENNYNATTATSKATWTVNLGPSCGGTADVPATLSKNFEINKVDMHVTAVMKPGTYQTGYEFSVDDVVFDFADGDFKGTDADPKDAIFAQDPNYVAPKVEKQGNGPTEFDLVLVAENGTYGNSTNYNFVPAEPNGKLVLGRANLWIYATGTKEYGSTKPEVLNFTIEEGDDVTWSDEDVEAFISNYSITASREEGENVGNYATTTTGPTVIGAAGSGYSVNYLPGVFTITKVNLTIYAESDTKMVLADDPDPWKISAEGLVNGDKIEDLLTATQYYGRNSANGWNSWHWNQPTITTLTREVSTYTVVREGGETIGDYPVTRITPTTAADYNETLQNYEVTWKVKDGAKLTITGIPAVVKVADATITYGQTYTPTLQFVSMAAYDSPYNRYIILDAIRNAKDEAGKTILTFDGIPEKPLVTGSPYTITVKDGQPKIVLDQVEVTYQSGKLTVTPFELNVVANDQGIAFTGEYCPWDVTINGVDYKEVEGYETGDCKISATGDALKDVLKLELKDENVKVGATPNAFVLNKEFALSGNYTINALVDDDIANNKDNSNAWLTKETIPYIPLDNNELAELLGVEPDEAGDNPSLLQTVLNEHRDKTVAVKMPARKMDAKEWYTWVLPFSVDPSVIFANDAWGYGALEILDEKETKGNRIVFELQMDAIKANTPFIVKLKNGITAEKMNEVIIPNVKIEDIDYLVDPTSVGKPDEDGNIVKFVGLYYDKKGFDADQRFNAYANGEAHRAFWAGGDNSGNIVVKRTNAYLQYANAEAAARSIILIEEEDGSLTAISGVENNVEISAEGVYNLNGMKIQGVPTQKGVYIQNGKKVVIK